ncbi:protein DETOXIFICATION 27-like isoform X2 [Actinidia eriantha]|uniref:protein DETOXIFICATION 27-like isoform X2 n=1 Tax=Actinidia eriantha TaxID=165200 RepID=UPI00258DFF9B|nr:protein DETOXIFICATION 27-like isoform X2 [Actinidia eriantha]
MTSGDAVEDAKVPLLDCSSSTVRSKYGEDEKNLDPTWRVWIESKKLWHIVGPTVVSRLASFSTFFIAQAVAGHLGDRQLAAVSIASNVIIGINYGLLLGMASALGTLCGQAFGAKKHHMLGIYLQRSWIVLFLCLENWYYRVLILMTGNLKNAEIAVDALSICMNINAWEMMIPLAFFAGTGVRVANELGAGNGKGAKFATIVSVMTSVVIGLFFWLLIMIFHNEIALIFSSSKPVLEAVNKLSILLAFTVLLNSIQPILSGVAVGSGWQSYIAYINLGCYYLIGVPLGFIMGWGFNHGVMGIWAGLVGGTAFQTLILTIITIRCDWEKEAEKATTHVIKWADEKT